MKILFLNLKERNSTTPLKKIILKLLSENTTCSGRSFFILTILLLIALQSSAQKHFSYNKEIYEIYQLASTLKLEKADAKLQQYKLKDPDNLASLHMANYIDFFTLFISEDYSVFKVRQKFKSQRLALIDEAGLDSPYTKFVKGEILLQWALIRAKFDEKLTAGREIYSAYKLLESNKKKYPDFIENNKSLSILHILASSLPRWVQKIIGVKGSVVEGVKEINKIAQVAKSGPYFYKEEVAAIHSYILYYQLSKKSEALKVFDDFDLDHKSSPLICFLKASIYQRSGDNEGAIKYLSEAPKGSDYADFHYLNFMMGRAKSFKLDQDADQYILNFINSFKGRHYIKEAYQKLAWYALVNDDLSGYKKYMALCKVKGALLVDEDKQAQKEAELGIIPNPVLLKARMLYDGGYYPKSYNVLTMNAHLFTTNNVFSLEFNYRLGRTLQALKNYPEAIVHFSSTIDQGTKRKEYYACSSALQLGIIYEEQKNKRLAKKYFELCLSLKPQEYQSSLHQKAKSGLLRL